MDRENDLPLHTATKVDEGKDEKEWDDHPEEQSYSLTKGTVPKEGHSQ